MRYTPPSADALYQMVAPIALYPDKLVAQVLAGATYPDQVTAAETWLGQNPSLKAAALTDAVDQQPWDPSIKSLTAFPNVLEQMASNLPWTVALGKAYYNDPTDVMNAIQVMRSRATKAGTLKSSPHLRVATVTAAPPSPPPPADLQQPVVMYSGPAVVVPPPAYISIEPADVQAVYVPRYDPQVVYGTPVPLYSSYRWATPAPVYSSGVVGPIPWPWARWPSVRACWWARSHRTTTTGAGMRGASTGGGHRSARPGFRARPCRRPWCGPRWCTGATPTSRSPARWWRTFTTA